MAVSYTMPSVTAANDVSIATFTVLRTGSSADMAAGASVGFQTEDVSAIAGTDYTATSGTLGFAPGVSEAFVDVAILPAAYARSTHVVFTLVLTGNVQATGTIEPSSPDNLAQTYLAVPDWSNMVPVPTSDAQNNKDSNLYYQTLSSGFSAPATSSLPLPIAYIRLGFARADMTRTISPTTTIRRRIRRQARNCKAACRPASARFTAM